MVIGIGGVSRAGKTSLALHMQKWYNSKSVLLLHQDDYVFPVEQIPTINGHIDWERPDAYDYQGLIEVINEAKKTYDIIVIEGLMVLCHEELMQLMDKLIYIKISKAVFLTRKTLDKRWGNEPEWYIEHIWNSHILYCKNTDDVDHVLVIDGESNNAERVKNYINE